MISLSAQSKGFLILANQLAQFLTNTFRNKYTPFLNKHIQASQTHLRIQTDRTLPTHFIHPSNHLHTKRKNIITNHMFYYFHLFSLNQWLDVNESMNAHFTTFRLFKIGVSKINCPHLRPPNLEYYWCLIIGEAHVIQTRDQKNNFLKKSNRCSYKKIESESKIDSFSNHKV